MDNLSTNLIGVGLYNVGEVARMTRVAPARIRRWVRGYQYTHVGESRRSEPLWRPQVPEIDGVIGLGFRDLTEIRVVDSLVRARFALPTVRLAMARARDLLGDERPFSTARFKTDGRSIFLEIADEARDPRLLDLLKRQYGMHHLIAPSFKDLDFDGDAAVRWWPLSHGKQVVVDPKRCFGQPIVSDGGVPTVVLAEAAVVEGSVAAAARYFGVSREAVRDAVQFEKRLAA